jgi:hypothetical protein
MTVALANCVSSFRSDRTSLVLLCLAWRQFLSISSTLQIAIQVAGSWTSMKLNDGGRYSGNSMYTIHGRQVCIYMPRSQLTCISYSASPLGVHQPLLLPMWTAKCHSRVKLQERTPVSITHAQGDRKLTLLSQCLETPVLFGMYGACPRSSVRSEDSDLRNHFATG